MILRTSGMRSWQPTSICGCLGATCPLPSAVVTVLIPKESGTQDPGKHRPKTLPDITIRCFHRVLAKRMKKDLPWNTRQKALRSGDGVADSMWLLQNIICQHQHMYKPLNIVFLDIKKVFDSPGVQVPLLKIKRIERLWASDDPVIRDILTMESAEYLVARQRQPSLHCGVLITSKDSLRAALAKNLHSTVDGRGLVQSDLVPHGGLPRPWAC
ncbi:hypothetical protein ACROYT_G015394 [Oculina patagonica]